jgi:magnesium-transporting ATPase (P-type)
MRHPPRRLTDRVIDRDMAAGVVFIGLVMAIATLFAIDLVLPGGLIEGGGSLEEARTMGFTVLVLAQLFNALNSRSNLASAFTALFTNLRLWGAIGISLVLQVVVVHLGVLNDAFGTVPLSLADWVVCVGIASTVLWADELRKVVARRRR